MKETSREVSRKIYFSMPPDSAVRNVYVFNIAHSEFSLCCIQEGLFYHFLAQEMRIGDGEVGKWKEEKFHSIEANGKILNNTMDGIINKRYVIKNPLAPLKYKKACKFLAQV